MKALTVVVCCFFLCACHNSPKTEQGPFAAELPYTPVISEEPGTGIVPEEEPTYTGEDRIEQIKHYLEKPRKIREELIARLEKATPEEADIIYKAGGYRFTELPEFYDRPEWMEYWMHRVMDMDWGDAGEKTEQDEQILGMFRAEGMEPMYEGEGYIDIHAIPSFFYHLFEPYVTDEAKQYMKIYTDYEGQIIFDAGLILNPTELYERSIRWEKYLTTYPEGKFYQEAINQYGYYMALQMFCRMDNTPMFDYFEKTVDEDQFNRIIQLVGSNPGSITDSILEAYIEAVQKNDLLYAEDIEKNIMSMSVLKDVNWEGLYY